jgi:hypothetical protein
LQTYSEGNGQAKAGGGGVTQPIFNGGGGGVWRRFGSKNISGSFTVGSLFSFYASIAASGGGFACAR